MRQLNIISIFRLIKTSEAVGMLLFKNWLN